VCTTGLRIDDDLNLYAYTYNDPLNKTDPKGEAAFVPLAIWGYRAYQVWRAASLAARAASATARAAAVNVAVNTAVESTKPEGQRNIPAAAAGGIGEALVTGPGGLAASGAKTAANYAGTMILSNAAGATAGAVTEAAVDPNRQVTAGQVLTSTLVGTAGGNASTVTRSGVSDTLAESGRAAATSERVGAAAEVAVDLATEKFESAINDQEAIRR
jgi:hypothetical protein